MTHPYFGKHTIPSRLILKLVPHTNRECGQLRFNHEDCPAGVDTKQRLYIKVPHDRPWERIAYCHNCGSSGYAKLRTDNHLFGELQVIPPEERKCEITYSSPSNAVFNFSEFPQAAKAVLTRVGINEEFHRTVKYCIYYDSELDRLIYRSTNYDGSTLYCQARAIYASQVPKYISFVYDRIVKNKKAVPMKGDNKEPEKDDRTLILTEDLLSALRLRRACPSVVTMPLFGVHLPMEELYSLSKRYDKEILIWLDNDNATVMQAAQTIANGLRMVGHTKPTIVYDPVITGVGLVDPKTYSDSTLIEILLKLGVINDV